jgi:hypothetical protein
MLTPLVSRHLLGVMQHSRQVQTEHTHSSEHVMDCTRTTIARHRVAHLTKSAPWGSGVNMKQTWCHPTGTLRRDRG